MKKIILTFMIIALPIAMLKSSEKPNFEINKKSCVSDKNTTLKGQILDKITNEPLAGAKVKLLDCNVEVFTDFDGNFIIENISEGEHIMQVEYVSYQTRFENITLQMSDKNTNRTIYLKNARN